LVGVVVGVFVGFFVGVAVARQFGHVPPVKQLSYAVCSPSQVSSASMPTPNAVAALQ
jgi:hypothetical protein